MTMSAGMIEAAVEQPGVQLLKARKAQPRREEAFAHEPDLVLDLSLLPARCRRAGGRLDQIMAAPLQEPPVAPAILAKEPRVHRRRQLILDAATADTPTEGDRPGTGAHPPPP